jgi:AcrR family transcriptional regulator
MAPPDPHGELPALSQRPERADAARNRRRILATARRLFAEHGVEAVSLERVAREAGVGKATLFRRFGDRQSLFLALLDEHERELQDAMLRGPPPLGPGAPPRARLLAFVDALLELSLEHLDLLLASETARPRARLETGAYAAWHQHTALLIAELRPDATAPLLAHLLLAGLDAELLTFLRTRAIPRQDLRTALHAHVDHLAGARGAHPEPRVSVVHPSS